MAEVTLEEMKDYLSFTDDIGTADDALLSGMLDAAQAYIESNLGFTFAEGFTEGVPADLKLAIQQLTAHWYENREAAGEALREAPFGVTQILRNHREYTFG